MPSNIKWGDKTGAPSGLGASATATSGWLPTPHAPRAPDFSGQEPLGACPKCGNRVYEHGVAYVCEKAVGPERACDFRSGRMILQQPIERDQMKKLLETGRTDLLTAFVSKKGRRFKAFLVKTPGGKIGFEFMAKAPKEAPKEAPADDKPPKKRRKAA